MDFCLELLMGEVGLLEGLGHDGFCGFLVKY